MKLTAEELQWIDKRMDWYTIKYQEIYDEIFDHIVTAIEEKRTNGDNRSINVVFQDVVDSNFNGYLGIEKIVSSHKKAFQQKLKSALRANYRHYSSWQTSSLMTGLIIVSGCYLPSNKITIGIMLICLFIGALIPVIYTIISSRKIKVARGKGSIIKGFVLMHSNILIFIFYWITQSIRWGRDSAPVLLKGILFSPIIYMVLFYLFAIHGLSVIKLCKQEFKIDG